jgi:hypothetical protein
MAIDITKTLRKALADLQAERKKIDQQIGAIEGALAGMGGRPRGGGRRAARPRPPARRAMSATARKALSRRMKASWARRRAEAEARSKGRRRKPPVRLPRSGSFHGRAADDLEDPQSLASIS